MPLTKKSLAERAEEELKALDGVIDYAERMMYQDGNRREYEPLRRHAYGKTVVLETENEGVLTFRLSSTAVVLTPNNCGYATPHSPVGRLCAVLQPGDEELSPRWGEYRVLEVRGFSRYQGPKFEPNVRNFQHMLVQEESAKDSVTDLRRLVAGGAVASTAAHQQVLAADDLAQDSPAGALAAPPLENVAPAQLAVNIFEVVDDELPDSAELGFADDDEDPTLVSASSTKDDHDYFGLSEVFYLNRTRAQDAVISRSPVGAMFVQGVAGSGKTSAALGRTKMLCDFNANNVFNESEFREIAGHSLDYWSGKFAGQFSQEGSVGFVRTGELIQYLKETCRRLDLPHLPVLEYPELRSRLREQRKLTRSKSSSKPWRGQAEGHQLHVATSMAWLRSADRAVAKYWAQALKNAIPDQKDLLSRVAPEDVPRAGGIAHLALDLLRKGIDDLAQELEHFSSKQRFAVDGLALKVQACIEGVRKAALGRDVLWASLSGTTWFAQNEHDLASQLVTARLPLYLRNGARLVFLNDDGILDPTLTLLSATGEAQLWSDDTRALLDKGELLVRDASDMTVPAKASGQRDLYLRLLPEAIERLFVLRGGALHRWAPQKGLGKARLKLLPAAADAQADEEAEPQADEHDALGAPDAPAVEKEVRSSLDALFAQGCRKALMQLLYFVADAYAQAVANHPSLFSDAKVASGIARQLQDKKLTDEDVDLLLCLSHLVSRGFKDAGRSVLAEPDFYQSVFVDEVQDFTEQQVFLMAEQAQPAYRAITVVGDIAQKLHNGSTIDITACFPEQPIEQVQLTENMRQLGAPALAWFSACFRACLQDGLENFAPSALLAKQLQEQAGQLHGPVLEWADDVAQLADLVMEHLQEVAHHQTAAVLLPNAETADALYAACKDRLAAQMVDAELSTKIDLSRRHVRHFTTVANAKGLEFDVVIVPALERYRMGDARDINHLYVALTRARRKLVLISDQGRAESPFDDVWRHYEDSIFAIASEAAAGQT